MNNKFNIFAGLIVVLVCFSSIAMSSPIPITALAITGVDPASVVNDVNNSVTITGADFDTAVRVFLETGESSVPLAIQTWAINSLIVTVPAGTASGIYTIRIENPGIDPVSFSSFTVSDPPPTATATETPTATATPPPPTALPPEPLPASTPWPTPYGRPQIVIMSYLTNVSEILPDKDFTLVVRLMNVGQFRAINAQAIFSSTELITLNNGGVAAVKNINAYNSIDVEQIMRLRDSTSLDGKSTVSVEMNLSYYDDRGVPFEEKFALNLPILNNGGTITAAGASSGRRSQLVITQSDTDIKPLQPGLQFTLSVHVKNKGTLPAKGVIMIVGGGSSSSSSGGTPQPGGISGGNGEFSNFAPAGSSNVQILGDFESGEELVATQNFVVNVSTNPGAYPMKISFSYLDEKRNTINDDQVITLMVYSLPNVDVSFTQPVNSLAVGQESELALKLVNLGKKTTTLGIMKAQTSNGSVQNDQVLVGPLEVGVPTTLNPKIIPAMAGPLELTITIDYTDDFNQPRTITKILKFEVLDMSVQPTTDPSMPADSSQTENFPFTTEENIWQQIWRFILGVLGLDSSIPSDSSQPPIDQPANSVGG